MRRSIMHVDFNNFYASVECLYNPDIRDKPVVVGGDVEARHGIVLAKNMLAKKCGIVTGDVLWQAKQKCSNVVVVPQSIVWEDGRVFEIDRVLDVRQAASLKAGGQGMRYLCRIRKREFYLFLEEDKYWFIEARAS